MLESQKSKFVRGIITSFQEEISCGECFEEMDRYVELLLNGRDAAELIPLVQDHLNRCGDCQDEMETLLLALRQMS